MDPQKLSQLDPKLRAAYERVMGTQIPTPPPTQSIQPADPTPSNIPPSNLFINQVPTQQPNPEEPVVSQPESIAPPQQPQPIQPETVPAPQTVAAPIQPPSNFVQMNSEISSPGNITPQSSTSSFTGTQAQAAVVKKKGGIMAPILFGFVGLIFIIIYTLFWTKIFNLKLPF